MYSIWARTTASDILLQPKGGQRNSMPRAPKKIPQRMCVGCREMKPKAELIRVVRAPDGSVTLDPVGKKPGRGAYVCRDAACLGRAIKQRQLERQLETSLGEETAQALRETLQALLAQLEEQANG